MAPYNPPNIGNMDKLDSVAKIDGYENWGTEEVADYFEREGLGDYREAIIYHKIVSLKVLM